VLVVYYCKFFVGGFVWGDGFLIKKKKKKKKKGEMGGGGGGFLSMIFETKREETTGDCKELHNEELHDLCTSPNIICII